MRSLPSSKRGERDTYSCATLLHGDASVCPPADDESELTALTATSCSYASAYDPGHEDDVMAILTSSVLNAAWGTTTSIGHGVKGALSPESIQSIISHHHGNRTTSTSVSSPSSYSSRHMTCSWSYNIPLADPSKRLVRWCRLLSSCIDGLYPPLASFAPVLRLLEHHPYEIYLLCVPASPTWGGTLRLRGGCDVTINDYGFLDDDDPPEVSYGATACGANDSNYGATAYLDPSMYEKYMFLASSSLLY